MIERSQILVDPGRAELFERLGRPGLFSGPYQEWIGSNNTHWAVVPVGNQAVGIGSHGAGWLYTPAGRVKDPALWDQSAAWQRSATPVELQDALGREVGRVRTGGLLARLLWVTHVSVLTSRSSTFRVPDVYIGTACYGHVRANWPLHWRGDLLAVFRAATRLHFAEWATAGGWSFDDRSPALLHVGDLKGTEDDRCDPGCGWHGRGRHHHLLVTVGPGFLGSLERFAADAGDGLRSYHFTPTGGRRAGVTLQALAKEQLVRGVFLPAYLGDPAVCRRYTSRQVAVLQAVTRELTRMKAKSRADAGRPLVFDGPEIPGFNGRGSVVCPGLVPGAEYVTFGGNGFRRGLGYKPFSPGGWAARAGYAAADAADAAGFLADLGVLARGLDLVPVAVARSGRVYPVAEMAALAATPGGRSVLSLTDVRIYTKADYLTRWSEYFGWPPLPPATTDTVELAVRLAVARSERGMTQKQVADELELDPSFMSRMLTGKVKWPRAAADRVRRWIESGETR